MIGMRRNPMLPSDTKIATFPAMGAATFDAACCIDAAAIATDLMAYESAESVIIAQFTNLVRPRSRCFSPRFDGFASFKEAA